MKLIVITTECFFEGETDAINMLFDNGLELLHLRKPNESEADTAGFIEQIHPQYHNSIVLHDHFSLTKRFHLKGIHLNRRNPVASENFHGTKSLSCHSFMELLENSDKMDYLFFSPVFDSISKKNYMSGLWDPIVYEIKEFTEEVAAQLAEWAFYDLKDKGVIHEKVIALGGVNKENMHKVKDYGFGGAAVLGGVWGDFPQQQDIENLLTRFKEIQHAANQ